MLLKLNYAHDLKLYSEIVIEADCLILQHGLDDLVSWSSKWQLTISFQKCLFFKAIRPVQHNSRQ